MIVIGRSRAQSTTPSALDLRANFTSLFTPSSPTEASGTLNSISLALLSEEKVLSNYCPYKAYLLPYFIFSVTKITL